MSWLFQVYIARNLTPEQAHAGLREIQAATDPREDHLLTLGERAKRNELRQYVPQPGVVKIPGVTIHEDPFPEWLHDIMRGRSSWIKRIALRLPPPPPFEMEFDEKVWSYEVQVAKRSNLERMFSWMKKVRAWGKRQPIGTAQFMDQHVVSLGMEDYEDIPSLHRVAMSGSPDIGDTRF